jgi:hypothetical protein
VYNDYKGRGMGCLLIAKHLDTIFEMGFEKAVTQVSSNNLEVLRISLMCGYRIRDMHYVYVKHR